MVKNMGILNALPALLPSLELHKSWTERIRMCSLQSRKRPQFCLEKLVKNLQKTPFSAKKKRQNAYPRILMTNSSLASAST